MSDINVSTRELHVNRLKDCDSGPHDMLEGEAPAVKAWLSERSEMIKSKGAKPFDTLFISEQQRPLSRSTVWLMITEIAKKAGLDHLSIHPHTMRHSAGYAMVNSGNDIRVIQGYSCTELLVRRFGTRIWTRSGSRGLRVSYEAGMHLEADDDRLVLHLSRS